MKILIQRILNISEENSLKLTENKYLVFFNFFIINNYFSTFIILIAYKLLIKIFICYQDILGI